jgi:pimeloyl-ACP methyl ester carboxylesterase
VFIILLPGMDGTGWLFQDFVKCLPDGMQTKVVSYPPDVLQSYEQLDEIVIQCLPVTERFIIIAESFSGPIALQLARRSLNNLAGVVLVSSFAYRPLGRMGPFLARLPFSFILRVPLWSFMLRGFLLGIDASDKDVQNVREVISQVPRHVLAGRLREALTSEHGRGKVGGGVQVVTVFAAQDRLLGRAARRSILEVCPDAVVETVSAPHLALQATPMAVLSVLKTHLPCLGQAEPEDGVKR